MKDRYDKWITERGLYIPPIAQTKCVEYCAEMMKAFPELKLKKGVVWSNDNIDNYKYPTEYPHCWLVDLDNEIVDPTKSQFNNLGKLIYREMTVEKQFTKCMGCGCYFDGFSPYCGKCEYSKQAENEQ